MFCPPVKKKLNPKEIALLNKQILFFCFSTIIASFSWKESLIICKLYVWNIFKYFVFFFIVKKILKLNKQNTFYKFINWNL